MSPPPRATSGARVALAYHPPPEKPPVTPLQASFPPPAYTLPVRVYWEDTDAGGVVFYANYLKFFERARTEWLRALGLGQQTLLDERGLLFVVGQVNIRYLQSARLDDALEITAAVADVGRSRLSIAQQARCNGVVLAQGVVDIVCVEKASWRAQRVPADILALMKP